MIVDKGRKEVILKRSMLSEEDHFLILVRGELSSQQKLKIYGN